MKKIVIIDTELHEIKNEKNIIIKKNKTIIKNLKFMNNLFLNNYSYKWLLEEWEYIDNNRIQLIFSNDGSKLKPVHIIANNNVGPKALFQTEKMLCLRIQNNMFELSKYSIDEQGIINSSVIQMGNFININELEKVSLYKEPIKHLIEKINNNNYSTPIYAEQI
jgi:hypothetical protein